MARLLERSSFSSVRRRRQAAVGQAGGLVGLLSCTVESQQPVVPEADHASADIECQINSGHSWELSEAAVPGGIVLEPGAAPPPPAASVPKVTVVLMQDTMNLVLPTLALDLRCGTTISTAEAGSSVDLAALPQISDYGDAENEKQLLSSVTGFGWWESVSSNVIAMLLLCLLIGLVLAVEAKFKCVGRDKIARFEHQNARLREKVTELVEVFSAHQRGTTNEGGVPWSGAVVSEEQSSNLGRRCRQMAVPLTNPSALHILGNMLRRLHVPDAERQLIVALCSQLSSGTIEAKRAIAEALLASNALPADIVHEFLQFSITQTEMEPRMMVQRKPASESDESPHRSTVVPSKNPLATKSLGTALTMNPLHEQSAVVIDASPNAGPKFSAMDDIAIKICED